MRVWGLLLLSATLAFGAFTARATASGSIVASKSPATYSDGESGWLKCTWSGLYFSPDGYRFGENTVSCWIDAHAFYYSTTSTSGSATYSWVPFQLSPGTHTFMIAYSTGWNRQYSEYEYAYASGTLTVQASVRITDIRVDPNSVAGDRATVSWSTSPSDSCDIFGYRLSGALANKYFTLPCGTHTITLAPPGDALMVHRTYFFVIYASRSGYATGQAESNLSPTDVSQSFAAEVYNQRYTWTGPDARSVWCFFHGIDYHPKAVMPGDVEHDHATTNPTSWTPFYLNAHLDAMGEYCTLFQDRLIGMRHLNVRLVVYDDSRPFTKSDLWMAGQDVAPKDSTFQVSGTVTFTISAGLQFGPFSAGMSAASSGGVYSMRYFTPTRDAAVQPDGSILAGWVDVEWNPGRSAGLDAMYYLAVMNTLAQRHQFEKLRFVVTYTITFADAYSVLGLWFWNTNNVVTQTITLGDGAVPREASAGSVDSFADLQAGTQSSIGFPGWP